MFMQPDTQTGAINPVFAGYAAQQLQEATGGIDRVFDNLRKIARGDDPDANGYNPLPAPSCPSWTIPVIPTAPPVIPAAAGIQRGEAAGHPTNHKNHSSDNPLRAP